MVIFYPTRKLGSVRNLGLLTLTLALTSLSSPTHAKDPGDTAAYRAVNFLPAAQLTREQHRIFTTFLEAPIIPVPGLDQDFFRGIDADFDEWHQSFDGRAATFLAVTHALTQTTFYLANEKTIQGIDLIKELKKTLGDRIIVTLHKAIFDEWQAAGGKYTFRLANGKEETGKIQVNPGGSMGGSLHAGYDRQGFTSNSKVPRLQINYRNSDSEADIDLDGYAPMKFGFLPNPNHLTWENSDVRYWYKNYVKKFGNPGFEVSQRKTETK